MSIKVEQLTYHYPNGRMGLDNITLQIQKGRKTAILGLNGSGKSTILNHMNGILMPQTGKLTVDGIAMNEDNIEAIRRKIGFLFDYPDHQLFSTTVYEDIAFGLENYQVNETKIDQKVRDIAKKLEVDHLLDQPPHQLSLGQKKRVATAGILVLEPEIVLCDEPFSGLDGPSLAYFKSILENWSQLGKTIVFSTHDVDLTYTWADDVVVLSDGKVVTAGTVDEVLMDQTFYDQTNIHEPFLFTLFKHTNHRPKSIKEAKLLLES